jgi:hypothetical protein
MGLIYSLTNLIDDTTLTSVSSEDPTFLKEYLYNKRPSYPFRFTAKTSCTINIDLGAPTAVTFAAILNHNLTSAPSDFTIHAGDSSACADWSDGFLRTADFNSSFMKISIAPETYQYWKFSFSDAGNASNIEIGEAFLGTWSAFTSAVKVRIEQADGPEYWLGKSKTHYGQDWTVYLAQNKRFIWTLTNIVANMSAVDEVELFLDDVQQAGSRFVFVPNDSYPWVYYATIDNVANYASNLDFGTRDIRDWQLNICTLTNGISLL